MNEVYLSGTIVELQPDLTPTDPAHFSFQLQFPHRDAANEITNVVLTVNAWNNLAHWSANQLRAGDEVLVKGSLMQRAFSNDHKSTEIAAGRIIVTGHREIQEHTDTAAIQNMESENVSSC